MKLRLILISVICILIMSISVTGFAAADILASDYAGNTDTLIDIKNPEAAVSSTASKVCVISAVATPGTTVTLYTLDTESNTYTKMYSEGAPLETVVGAAGLYAQNIELKAGVNNILVTAESGELVETTRLEITLIKNSLSDTIRNIWQAIISH